VTPKLFGCSTEYSSTAERYSKLIASLLQKLANLQVFDTRETYLDKLNDLLERDKSKMRNFVTEISNPAHVLPLSPDKKKNYSVKIDIAGVGARLCKYISNNLPKLEQELPDRTVVRFITELQTIYDEMEFLTRKFKADQKKRRDHQNTVALISPDSNKKKKSSGPLVLRSRESDKKEKEKENEKEKVLEIRERHPFPFYISIPPYKKGDIPDPVDDYVHHLLNALDLARQAYEEIEKKVY